MTTSPLAIAVVGHTNTGKTSLMRTLTRDVGFGEVSDHPGVTRHVEGSALYVGGEKVVELYDTPGLEDSIGLLDLLDSMRANRRVEGIEVIQRFLESAGARGRFAQEAKAIGQVVRSDVALYVIDARDRVLGKHRDELEILARCARPVVPVLNFVASPHAQTALWREHLSRANMHAVAEFDTVVLDGAGEQRLFEKIRSLLDHHRQTLTAIIEDRQRHRTALISASAKIIADLLLDVAAFAVTAPTQDKPAQTSALEQFKHRIVEREARAVHELLMLHRFRTEDYEADQLPIENGRWGIDLFSPAAMKQSGVHAGGGAAAGALAGLTIDAMVGGMSLGAATAIGAAIGAALGVSGGRHRQLIKAARGVTELRCDDATLRLLAARQMSLTHALIRRGHASVAPMKVHAVQRRLQLPPGRMAAIDQARLTPSWSSLNGPTNSFLSVESRQLAADELAAQLESRIHSGE